MAETLQYFFSLKSFTDFSQVGQGSAYVDWPSGWSLVLTDIRGSTKAIQEGRYKEVNLIGAASIAAYVKFAGTQEVPFVFGGDGATLLVPNSLLPDLLNELQSLQNLSQAKFDLQLRVGYVDVDVLKNLGQQLKVGKYELSPGNYLAQFSGGAVSLAENLVKSNDPRAKILTTQEGQELGKISGLSCRLKPLKSSQGKMLTLLCKPVKEEDSIEVIRQVVEKLMSILNNSIQTATPVRDQGMRWPFFPATSGYEALFEKGESFYWVQWIKTTLFAMISNLSLRFEFPMGGFIPKNYKRELQMNSDFKKFDETLRMVLDCTEEQIQRIRSLMSELQQQQKVFFGMHISDEALMTCMVQSPTKNRHIHFIDGSNGGYAMAAVQLKEQMKSKSK